VRCCMRRCRHHHCECQPFARRRFFSRNRLSRCNPLVILGPGR
jgi:hypothetical protein